MMANQNKLKLLKMKIKNTEKQAKNKTIIIN